MTSPYQFYQFWINADDADVPKYTRYFTLRSREEVLEMEASCDAREQKRRLAEELTRRIHSDEAYESVMNVSELLFSRQAGKEQLLNLKAGELETVAAEIPSFRIDPSALREGINIIDLLAEATGIVASKGDARRAIKGNAISINKDKISDFEATVNGESLLHGKFIMVESGKKNKYMLIAE